MGAENQSGSDGSPGGASSLNVQGENDFIVRVSGGLGSEGGGVDANDIGDDGLDGVRLDPEPLPQGWTETLRFGPGVAAFVAPVTPTTSGPSAPAPLIQQFGKPESGTCDAAAPGSLDWAGVSSGGWGESWAQWMNGGNGGAVCNRTLVYSPRGMWVVG